MQFEAERFAQLSVNAQLKLQELETDIGVDAIAFSEGPHPCYLSDEDFQKILELSDKLGVTLVAYQGSRTKVFNIMMLNKIEDAFPTPKALSDSQLARLSSLEREMGKTLVAFPKA